MMDTCSSVCSQGRGVTSQRAYTPPLGLLWFMDQAMTSFILPLEKVETGIITMTSGNLILGLLSNFDTLCTNLLSIDQTDFLPGF